MGVKLIFFGIFLTQAFYSLAIAEPTQDKQALLDFMRSIQHSRLLNWNKDSSACSQWTGVTCNHNKSRIIAVRLPGFGFRGPIPSHTLGRLSALQILSLRSNDLSDPLPSDFSTLGDLTALYLQSNKFHGPLPSAFSVWKNLSIVNLSNNSFNGSIPSSISNLPHLTALILANNSLSGEIPDLNLPSLQMLDLSNNHLNGIIPQSLLRFPSSSFSGNNLSPSNLPPSHVPGVPSSNQTSMKSSKLSEPAILGIIIGACALGFVILAALLILCYSKKEGENGIVSESIRKEKPVKRAISGSQDRNSRLVFFDGSNLAFDLEDLLRASAEVLGKGTFGTTYKAALEDTTTVAVKRLKEVNVGERDFEQLMDTVGSIRHENVAALRAYYCSKDEKLMVYDYYSQGSVSSMLHANRGEDQMPLHWETRLRIAIGAARGIAHIHTHNGGKFVHGNIKGSNIFLNSRQYGCVSDLGLATVASQLAPPMMRTGGYRAPEVTDTRKVSQASDVYSFGVLLLELLTGKSPIHAMGGDEAVHLVRWVNSVVREEWTAEVFDIQLLRHPNIEEEMVEMLQIGMACVVRIPDQRPKMSEVVKTLEDIRQVNSGTKSNASTPTLTPPIAETGPTSVPVK